MPKIITLFLMFSMLGSIFLSVTILLVVKLVTDHFLRKIGYFPKKAQVEYQQIQADLNLVASDFTEIRCQLDDIEPYLQQMEFLKYTGKHEQKD